MAQTMTLYRGSASVSSSSSTLIITAPSGSYTRMITGRIVVKNASNTVNEARTTLYVLRSGGPGGNRVNVIGGAYITGDGGLTFEYYSLAVQGISPLERSGEISYRLYPAANYSLAMPMTGAGASGWSENARPGRLSSTSGVPKDFYVGPGDEIYFGQSNTPGYSATVYYTFLGITES